MRTRYIVAYDICDPKRLRMVAKTCESFGSRIQFSVFECALDDLKYSSAKSQLDDLINHDEDQILFISLGPEKSEQAFRIEALGQPYVTRSRLTVV